MSNSVASFALAPVLEPGVFVFCSVPDLSNLHNTEIVATVREPEGLSVIASETQAAAQGWKILCRVVWIRFNLATDLAAVGLTAAVSAALGGAGIPCNMVAGAYHDHVFVPAERAAEALRLLEQLRVTMADKK